MTEPTVPQTAYPMDTSAEPMVCVTRGSLVECIHRGHIAVVDVQGRVLYSLGNPDYVTYFRSSAKPLQVLPVIESGAADRFGFTAEEIAVFCGSHNAEEAHQSAVRSALAKIGVGEEALRSGPHPPSDRAMAEALIREGKKPQPIHSNCSGKHTGMIAVAVHQGATVEDYLLDTHPVQRQMLRTVAEMCDWPEERIVVGVDGCGVPVFGLPLSRMALAYARLADPSGLPEPRRSAVRRVVEAMLSHPHLVAGTRRLDTDLMVAAGRKLIAKVGAEGIYCVGVLDRGIGIAIKAEDGSHRGRDPAVIETLRQLGVLTEDELEALARYHRPPVKNFHGRVVGEVVPVFTLRAHAAAAGQGGDR